MNTPLQVPYRQMGTAGKAGGWMPMLPVTLRLNSWTRTELALVDSGAAVNILPYHLGLQLGADWNQFTGAFPLVGSLGNYPAKPVFLEAVIGHFSPVRFAFGWTQAPHARLLFGQTNFFEEFDVCFFASQKRFQVQPCTP